MEEPTLFRSKKKVIAALFAICLCIPHAFSHDERKADVVVYLESGKELTRIFTGNIPGPYDLSALLDNKLNENLILLDEKIKSAKEIVDLKIEKACLPGGEEYLIEYLSEGKKLAKEIDAIFQSTSAMLSHGIDELFLSIGKKFMYPAGSFSESNLTKKEEEFRKGVKLKNQKKKKVKKKCC